MPYFKNPVDFPAEDLLVYMERLFRAADSIQIFRVLGGEPFLYRDIEPILIKALNSPKVKTVEIVTNGTIIPPKGLTETLKHPKLKIQISYYGKYSRHAEEIKSFCDKEGIKCVIRRPEGKTWFDAGDLACRNRSVDELKKQLKRCGNICRNFQNGKLYFCPRASFGTKLGIPDNPNDFVDLREEADIKTLKKRIFELNQRRFIAACNYCNEGTDNFVPIPVAEQL